ncbi:MAG: glycine cleavage system protein H [Alphaproteobacteria bacterium]|jgi:glycine cleavage system H protein|nr:glycine cleavage system protein H [Alphaproteobacteria bacterium]PPR14395.1 MAG: Glycine cleavage system H protein [Alphaproteobacteria bacterium MarineAlpha12_Bin1]|tara:strand:+ start:5101 stop:5478 length:378 start_codon:yes stop_codon:yes gene_type:complete
MDERRYTRDHEWIKIDKDIAIIGITEFAQEQLGDIVFVELPEVGKLLSKGDEAAVLESVKAAAEVYCPIGGEVIEVNDGLNDDPSVVNNDPYGKGWFIKLRVTDPESIDQLMDELDYNSFVESVT